MAKKPIKVNESLSYEEAVRAIKAMKGFRTFIGEEEIAEFCTLKKIPTEIPSLDFLLGGGLTEGRITIFAGNPSSCKSTTTLQIVSAVQKYWREQGVMKFVLIFDVEGALDRDYAKHLGVDLQYVIVAQNKKVLEEIFEEADKTIAMGFIGMLIIDSVDATVPRKSDDNQYGNTMGSQSGALAAHLPSIFSKIIEHNVTTILIKQARVKMGVMSKGEIITFNGGKALRHFSDTILIMKRLSDRDLNYAPIQTKAEKTRSSRMGLSYDLPLGNCGIDKVRDLVRLASDKQFGVITTGGGGWMTFGEYKEQGEEKFTNLVRTNEELRNELMEVVYRDIINVGTIIGTSTSQAGDLNTEFEDDVAKED